MTKVHKLLDSLGYSYTVMPEVMRYTPLIVSDSEDVTPERYKEIIETDRNSIISTHIKPPVLGVDDGFGLIEVTYRTPRAISR